jgi:hypothetical protein
MPINAPAFFGNAAKLSVAVALMVASTANVAARQGNELAYLATFKNGSLNASTDLLGLGPMKTGDTQVADTNPSWTPQEDELILQITRPQTVGGPVAAGVFAAPASFGPGTIFEEQATFINPIGPHEANTVWAVALSARTGGNNDLPAETRVVATLQVADKHLRLNAVGAQSGGPTFVNLPNDIYPAIFHPTDPQPFTLGLLIDRVSGRGRVSLTVGDRTFSRDVDFPAFQADTGPVISAVGPAIAIALGSGVTASVHVREFRILLPSN